MSACFGIAMMVVGFLFVVTGAAGLMFLALFVAWFKAMKGWA